MPVIGRLDGQVDEIIISPISRRRREDEREEDAPPPAPPEPSASPERPAPAPAHTPQGGESSAGAGELPAWLL
ncbi:MAG TPA: hypothetical protein VF668_24235 [Pyrinomonadaceae bacterium]|jgi:hypothetical protein